MQYLCHMEVREIIKKAYSKYMCLQCEDFYIEYDEKRNLLTLWWHVFMDRYVNLLRVKQVANFVRKHNNNVLIYDSFGNQY